MKRNMDLVRSKRIRTRIEKGRAICRSNKEQRPNKSLARRDLSKRRTRNDNTSVDEYCLSCFCVLL